MSVQDGSPIGQPGGGTPPGRADATNSSSDAASRGAPADATGPIERSTGGRMFAGRYQLLARRGTATDVALFEAVDTATDRSVAVKIVHPDICATPGFDERFHATMREVAATRHPNLTEVIDVGTSTWSGRTVQYVVCENLTGGSLRDLRDRGRQLSASQVVMIGLDACRALDVAHRAGFVHGDIRPANLVFGEDGRLRLADVGLADLVSDSWWVEPTGVNIEKAKFASPEQAQGLEPTTKSDVYALCLCLLEAVTGQLPFIGDSSVATLSNRVDKLMPVSADLGPLAAVLERAGRPDPADRSSASEFGRALHQAAEKLPRPAPLALLSGGLFASAPAAVDPTSPTGLLRRPPSDLAAVPDQSTADGPEPADHLATGAPVEPPVVDSSTPPSTTDPTGPPEVTDGAKPWLPAPTRGGQVTGDPVDPPAAETVADLALDHGTPNPVASADAQAADAADAADAPDAAAGVVPAPPGAPVSPDHSTGPVSATGTATSDAPVSLREVLRSGPATGATASGPSGLDDLERPGGSVVERTLDADDAPTRPGRRRWVIVAAAVLLAAVVAGTIVWWSGRTQSHEVPDLTTLEQSVALNVISEFGWNVVTVEAADDEIAAGVVIRTDPAAGATLVEGAEFTLVVSTGPAPRELPDIIGSTVEQATTDLLALGLVLEIGERVFDDEIPVDEVISWTVPDQPALQAGDTVLPGTSIVVVISSGPAPRVVPELAAATLADATAALAAQDLLVVVTLEEFSNDVAVGSVIAQDPIAGTALAPGDTVSVVVSKGPDLVAIPALGGLTLQQATDALTTAGLALGVVTGDPAGVNVLAEVGGVSIASGVTFPRGTAIDLTFAVPVPPEDPAATVAPA